jgi:hypothetical protein
VDQRDPAVTSLRADVDLLQRAPRRRRAKEIVLGMSNGAVMIKGILAAWPHL